MSFKYENDVLKNRATALLKEDNCTILNDINIQYDNLNKINNEIKNKLLEFFKEREFEIENINDFCIANIEWYDIITELSQKIEAIFHQYN